MQLFLVLFLFYTQIEAKSTRIIGGTLANSEEFPFVVKIVQNNGTEGTSCGGSILNKEWILTAADCIHHDNNLAIYFGHPSTLEAMLVVVPSGNSILHPGFNPETLENNLGLVKLDTALRLNENVKPIDVLGEQTLGSYITVWTLGWGTTSDGDVSSSSSLYHVALSTIPNNQCESSFDNFEIEETMVCAVGTTIQGICRGDEGGPLVQIINNQVVQVGIASHYEIDKCQSFLPSVFQRTAEYHEWVKDIVGEIGNKDDEITDDDDDNDNGSGSGEGSADDNDIDDNNNNGSGSGEGSGDNDKDDNNSAELKHTVPFTILLFVLSFFHI